MHACEQKRCTAISSVAKRALTCGWQQLNDTHRSLLRCPRAVRIVRWRERSLRICVGLVARHKHGMSFMGCCCLPRLHLLHLSALVARALPTLPTYKAIWTSSCVTRNVVTTLASTFYYIAFWSRIYAEKLPRHKQLMQPSTSTLTAMPSWHAQRCIAPSVITA